MKTKAVRLYGEMDLRLDEFELPEMQDDEIMAEVVNGKISIRKVTNLSFSLTLEISEAMLQDILSIIWEGMPQRSSFLIRLWKMVHY